MTQKLELLKEQIEKSNPAFTEKSLRRTIEVIIIKIEKLGFMAKIEEEKIEEVINQIPKEWKIIIRK